MEQAEQPRPERVAVHDVEADHDGAVVAALLDGLVAELLRDPPRAGRLDQHQSTDGPVVTERHGVATQVLLRVEVVRWGRELPGLTHRDGALDAVGPERARRIARAVVA